MDRWFGPIGSTVWYGMAGQVRWEVTDERGVMGERGHLICVIQRPSPRRQSSSRKAELPVSEWTSSMNGDGNAHRFSAQSCSGWRVVPLGSPFVVPLALPYVVPLALPYVVPLGTRDTQVCPCPRSQAFIRLEPWNGSSGTGGPSGPSLPGHRSWAARLL